MTQLTFAAAGRLAAWRPGAGLARRGAWPPRALAWPAVAGRCRRRETGDYIVAVVNQELVTAAEVQQRLARVRADAQQTRAQLPPPAVLRQQVVDVLIDERVLVTNARESGPGSTKPSSTGPSPTSPCRTS